MENRRLARQVREGRPGHADGTLDAATVATARQSVAAYHWRDPLRALKADSDGRPVSLEIGGALAPLSRALRRTHQWRGFEWDVRWGSSYDILHKTSTQLVKGWITSGLVNMLILHLPTECKSPQAMVQVLCLLFMESIRAQIPVLLAAKATHEAWSTHPLRTIQQRMDVLTTTVDLCSCGNTARNRTMLLSSRCGLEFLKLH